MTRCICGHDRYQHGIEEVGDTHCDLWALCGCSYFQDDDEAANGKDLRCSTEGPWGGWARFGGDAGVPEAEPEPVSPAWGWAW